MRYPISGTATNQVPPNTSTGATGVATLHSINGGSGGRTFWLRGVRMQSTGTSGVVELYDATTQSTATTHPIRVCLASATFHANILPCIIEFPAPGIKFNNNYVLARLAASGAIAINGMSITGYEE